MVQTQPHPPLNGKIMTNSEQKKIIDKIKIILNDQDQNSHIHKLLEIEKDYPNDVAIKQAISQTYLKMDENTKALEYINEADKLSPGNYAIKYNLGMMHKKFKKYDEAINFFKESVKLNSKFKEGFNILADIYYNKKDYQTSADYYLKSKHIDKTKNNLFALNRLAETLLRLYPIKQNKDLLIEAKKNYQIIDNLTPNNDIILQNIININNLLGLRMDSVLIDKSKNGIFVLDISTNAIKVEY